MRNMSFALTTDQMRKRTKTVTRRMKWLNTKAGDEIQACVKCMGLKPGEKIDRICVIRATKVNREALFEITQEDTVREGFPHLTKDEFIGMFCEHNKCEPADFITRIEFEYVD